MDTYAFGDSITSGYGTSHRFTDIVASFTGNPITNLGIPSSQIQDQIASIYGVQSLDEAIFLSGFNDARAYGTSSDTYEKALKSAIAWTVSPNRVVAQSSAFSFTGNWNNVSVYGGAIGKYSSVVGDSAEVTVSGKTIYIGSIALSSGGGSLRVKVDNVDYGVFSCNGCSTSVSGLIYAPFLICIEGLVDGQHFIKITHEGVGNVYIDWAGSPSNLPIVYLGECLTMPDSGYALGSPSWNHSSGAVVAQYNRILLKTAGMFISHGAKVSIIPFPYDPARHAQGDVIHPNDLGHSVIALAFCDKL